MPTITTVGSDGVRVLQAVTVSGGQSITVSTAAELAAALANPGSASLILCNDGAYGSLSFTQKPAGPIEVRAKNPGGATFTTAFFQSGAKNIKLSRFSGSSMKIGLSTDCGFEAVSAHYLEWGSYSGQGQTVAVPVRPYARGCLIAATGDSDASYLTACQDGLVEKCKITGVNQNLGTNHADAMQVFPYNKVAGLTVRQNWFGGDVSAQGFFIKDGPSTGVVVENNLFSDGFTDVQQIIQFYSAAGGVCRRNTAWVGPGTLRYGDGDSGQYVVEGNVLKMIYADPGPAPAVAAPTIPNLLGSGTQIRYPGDVVLAAGQAPVFRDPANFDYRLADGHGYPPAGVDWVPGAYGTAWSG